MKPISHSVSFVWITDLNHIPQYLRLACFTPFEAACALHGYEVIRSEGGITELGLHIDYCSETECPSVPGSVEHASSIFRTEKVIQRSFLDAKYIDVDALVEWAVATAELAADSELAQSVRRKKMCLARSADDASEKLAALLEVNAGLETKVAELARKCKNTGKQFAEQRSKVLGAALNALFNNLVKPSSGGELTATDVARHLEDFRFKYGLENDAPVYDTIYDHIRQAVNPKINNEK